MKTLEPKPRIPLLILKSKCSLGLPLLPHQSSFLYLLGRLVVLEGSVDPHQGLRIRIIHLRHTLPLGRRRNRSESAFVRLPKLLRVCIWSFGQREFLTYVHLGFRLATHMYLHCNDMCKLALTMFELFIPTYNVSWPKLSPFGHPTQVDTSRSQVVRCYRNALTNDMREIYGLLATFVNLRADLWSCLATLFKSVRKFWFCKLILTCLARA